MAPVVWFAIACGVLAILYGILTSRSVLAMDAGSERMQEISAAVQEGAAAFLKKEYTWVSGFVVVIAICGIVATYVGVPRVTSCPNRLVPSRSYR